MRRESTVPQCKRVVLAAADPVSRIVSFDWRELFVQLVFGKRSLLNACRYLSHTADQSACGVQLSRSVRRRLLATGIPETEQHCCHSSQDGGAVTHCTRPCENNRQTQVTVNKRTNCDQFFHKFKLLKDQPRAAMSMISHRTGFSSNRFAICRSLKSRQKENIKK